MSTYYLLDQFQGAMPIIDVTSNESGSADSTGAVVIKIPSGVPIHGEPKNLAELEEAKLSGLHAKYQGYAYGLYDGCLTDDLVDVSDSFNIMLSSGSSNHCIVMDGGVLTTSEIQLDASPRTFVVVWEAYAVVMSDPSTGRASRVYHELDPSALECTIAFDDGASARVSGSGLVQQSSTGSSIATLSFLNVEGGRVFLGSWAILYNGVSNNSF